MRDHIENIRGKAAAYRILAIEAIIIAALALLLYLSVNGIAAYSAVLGGGIFVIPNALFARYVFRYSAAISVDLAMRWFLVGEAIKLITTVMLFVACFILVKPLNVMALFATYAGMIIINLAGMAFIKTD